MNLKMLSQLCLCFFVALISATYACAFSLCAQALSKNVNEKYNSAQVSSYIFTDSDLDQLKNAYHNLRVPQFVTDIALGKDKPVNDMVSVSKKFVEPSLDGLAVFIPNTPVYHSSNEFKWYEEKGEINKAKDGPNGLTLSTWFVHPGFRKTLLGPASPTIKSLEAEGAPYLASILDLNKSHLPHLKELQRLSKSHISKVYGVDEKDSVELYFHFPYAPKTVTLHLHIRVNQTTYGLERAKSYDLLEIINHLESGSDIKELILARQRQLGGYLLTNSGVVEDLLTRQGIGSVGRVANPFFGLD